MRRALGLAILVAGMAGCSSSPTGPATDSGADIAPEFRATAFTVNSKFEIDFFTFIPCANGGAGEFVDFSGTLHDIFHVTINGSNFVLRFHDQPQGITGTGESTGDVYHATGVTQEITRSGKVGFTDTFINNFKLIGPGPNNNFLVHENFHVTVNGNATVTVVHDNFTFTCR
jgi:hypothetical protein